MSELKATGSERRLQAFSLYFVNFLFFAYSFFLFLFLFWFSFFFFSLNFFWVPVPLRARATLFRQAAQMKFHILINVGNQSQATDNVEGGAERWLCIDDTRDRKFSCDSKKVDSAMPPKVNPIKVYHLTNLSRYCSYVTNIVIIQ